MRKLLTSGLLILLCSANAFAQVNHWETIVTQGDFYRYTIPTIEPAAGWRLTGFNDAGWPGGKAGIGYGDADDSTIVADGTTVVYMRRQFNVVSTANIQSALLHLDYDDAFVAYLNGVEIARANVGTPGTPPLFTDAAWGDHEAMLYDGGTPEAFQVDGATLAASLVTGQNTLAIQVYNTSSGSSDLSATPFLSLGITDGSLTYGPTPPWFVAPVALSTRLPIILINTAGQSIPYGTKINATMQVIDHPGGAVNTETDAPDGYSGRIGIEVRGASSSGYDQQPYGLETRKVASDDDTDVAFLGMPAESDWALISNWNDKSFLRNMLSYRIARGMGNYAPRNRLCEVIVNGEYRGIYLATEKIKRDNNRVDIAKLDDDDNAGDSVTGGYIFQINYWDWDNSWQAGYAPIDHPGIDVHYVYDYPKATSITDPQKAYLHSYVDSVEGALYSDAFMDTAVGYRHYLDINSFVDYLVVSEVSRNVDGFKKSCHFYKDKASKGGKVHAGPVWDFDWAWKNVNGCYFGAQDGSQWSYLVNDCNTDVYSNGWSVRLMQDSNFVNQFYCRYHSLRDSTLNTDDLLGFVDSMAAVLDTPQMRHYQVYDTWGYDTGAPETDPPSNSYAEEITKLKSWITTRLTWLDANIPGHCPVEQPATSVATASSLGTGGARIFPNPAREVLRVQTGDARHRAIALVDMAGRQLATAPIRNGAAMMLLSRQLPAGLYQYRILGEGGEVAQAGKVVVE